MNTLSPPAVSAATDTPHVDGKQPALETHPKKNFVVLSSCPEAWGGSEELWNGAALQLAEAGHKLHVVKTHVEPEHHRVVQLKQAGATVSDFFAIRLPKTVDYMRRVTPRRYHHRFSDPAYSWLCRSLRQWRPDLVIISQGDNFDGLQFVQACHDCHLPYVLICQKASDQKWPADSERPLMRRAFSEAQRCYFVSQHNWNVTELQMGVRLTNAEVVRNPFLTRIAEPLPWPEMPSGRFQLACVARMFALEKGQDILLQVLAQEKWRRRPLDVTFFGKGINSEGLQAMAAMLNVENVHFAGFTSDVVDIWRTHHALVLPSRAEGLPLSLIEAMLCGRPGIITMVGGTAEVVDDNETGFLASGASISEFDSVMERAWERRDDWEQIGHTASQRIRTAVMEDPCGVFTVKLLEVCHK